MSCGSVKHKIKGAFDKVVEWDKAIIKKCQDKFVKGNCEGQQKTGDDTW